MAKAKRWTGYALTGLFTLFMLFDVGLKLIGHPMVEKTMTELGFPSGLGFPIGVMEGLCLVLYLVPRTAVRGTRYRTRHRPSITPMGKPRPDGKPSSVMVFSTMGWPISFRPTSNNMNRVNSPVSA